MQLTPPPSQRSSSSASVVLPFFFNCHLQWLISLSLTLSSLLTQHVLLASFICTQMLNFQLYSNNAQSFISSPWVPFLPNHCLLSVTWRFPRLQWFTCFISNIKSIIFIFYPVFIWILFSWSVASSSAQLPTSATKLFNIHLSPELPLHQSSILKFSFQSYLLSVSADASAWA